MSKNVMLYGGPKDGTMIVVEDHMRSLNVACGNKLDLWMDRLKEPQMLAFEVVTYRETSPCLSPFDFAIFEAPEGNK